jgi:hypothetical protein
LAEYEQHLLVYLRLLAVIMSVDMRISTQELSDTDMTRGASSDDLLTELCEVFDAVIDRPCVLVSDLVAPTRALDWH